MAVGANQCVGIGHFIAVLVLVGPDGLRQIFQIDLMANAGAGRHNAEVVECLLTPFQESIAFDIAFVFAFDIDFKCARIAEFINHHRVVNHQINRVQRVDLFGIPPKADNPVTHGSQINHGRHTGKVLHQHAGRAIGDLARVFAATGGPFGKGLDVVNRYGFAIFKPQHVFQHHL